MVITDAEYGAGLNRLPDATVAAPRWSLHLRGHLLLFERRPASAYPAQAGARLLVAAGALEVARLAALTWLRAIPLWLLLPALLVCGLLLVRIAGVQLSQLGLRGWRHWTAIERSYFLQVVVIANIVFATVLAGPIADRLVQSDMAWSLWHGFVPYLVFGFYQEFVYRGMVQLELVRRWGAVAGIVVANVLYTFGPLHWDYFTSRASFAIPMFASIFAIGLLFGVLYHRSGNLWIVGVFHAIGNACIVWSLGQAR